MDKKNVALVVDSENISHRHIKEIIEKTNNYIEKNTDLKLTHKVAFANWNINQNEKWSEALIENAIKPIHSPNYSSCKNGSDISLVIYCMDAVFNKNIDTFIIATGDSDFTALVYKLTEYGKNVIIVSDSYVAKSLKHSTEFWCLKEVQNGKKTNNNKEINDSSKEKSKENKEIEKFVPINKLNKKEIIESHKRILKNIYNKNERSFNDKNEKQFIDSSYVFNELCKQIRDKPIDKNYKELGYKTLIDYFRDLKIFRFKTIKHPNSSVTLIKLL